MAPDREPDERKEAGTEGGAPSQKALPSPAAAVRRKAWRCPQPEGPARPSAKVSTLEPRWASRTTAATANTADDRFIFALDCADGNQFSFTLA